MAKELTIGVTEFKANCLKLLNDVAARRVRLTVTRRGRPIARVLNAETRPPKLHGYMKRSVTILGDIVAPAEPDWDILKD